MRQGNQNQKVKIFRYVTENTFDSYMWQILENKQKFISQIMTSKSPVRACEDVDDVALTYAEIKALATGNPYIKEKMDLDIQVSKLKLMKANHTSQIYRLETDITRNYPMQITSMKERIAGLNADWEVAKSLLQKEKDDFSITVSGKVYIDRKEAGTVLIAACSGLKTVQVSGTVGEFHGFSLSASYDSFNQCYNLTIKGKCSYTVEVGKDALGNIMRIQNALTGIEKKLPEAKLKLETLQEQLLSAQEEVKKPFAQEAELAEKMKRLDELNILLNTDGKSNHEEIDVEEYTMSSYESYDSSEGQQEKKSAEHLSSCLQALIVGSAQAENGVYTMNAEELPYASFRLLKEECEREGISDHIIFGESGDVLCQDLSDVYKIPELSIQKSNETPEIKKSIAPSM